MLVGNISLYCYSDYLSYVPAKHCTADVLYLQRGEMLINLVSYDRGAIHTRIKPSHNLICSL